MEHDAPYMAHVPGGRTGKIGRIGRMVWTVNRSDEFE